MTGLRAVDIEDTGDGSTSSRTFPPLAHAGKGKLLYVRPPPTMASQTPRLQLARPGTFMASCT